jgi:protein-S-isoprenylcysteine O-methyltransferase Ste14
MHSLENRLPPPILVLILGFGMVGLAWAWPGGLPAWRWWIAGAAFLLAGVFGFPAFRAFARARTTINPVRIEGASTLVTTGIYGITRNPMYLSLTLLLVALAAALGSILGMPGPVIFALWINWLQIVPEERVLRAKFGAAYEAYTARVRRWI